MQSFSNEAPLKAWGMAQTESLSFAACAVLLFVSCALVVAQLPALQPGVVPGSCDAGEDTERPVKHSRDQGVDEFQLPCIVQLQGGQDIGCNVGLLLDRQAAGVELFPEVLTPSMLRRSAKKNRPPGRSTRHPRRERCPWTHSNVRTRY